MIFAKRFLMVPATLLAASLTLPAAIAHADPDPNLPTLEAANPQISNPDQIVPGQVITMPGGGDYTVRPGDTLNAIAAQVQAPPAAPPVLPPPLLAATPEPAPIEAPPPPRRAYSVNWDSVAACESGNNWAINTGNGFSGGLQWAPGTWASYRAPSDPINAWQASRDQQIAAAERLFAVSGTRPWPVCGRRG